MQLLSNEGERLVFLLDKEEVELLQHLVELGCSAQRRPVRFSRRPQDLPAGASEDFAAATHRSQAVGRAFLHRVFQPGGGFLQASTADGQGSGLTLSRPQLEQLLQALNDIKLAHWEQLGCPEEPSVADDAAPDELPSHLVMDLVNQVQMLLLSAVATPR